MPTVRFDWLSRPPEEIQRRVVAIGNFDGVHRGHAELLRVGRTVADSVSRPLFAVTFDPHPLKLLSPEKYQPPLTTIEERSKWLHKSGADGVIVLETTPGLLALGPEAFCESILQTALEVKGIVEGFNFRFGHNREGSNESLRQFCAGLGVPFREVLAFSLGTEPVSSSRVRQAIESGNIAEAIELMGHRYTLKGRVIEGAKRGRTLGIPTANLDGIETLIPATGVYAVRVECSRGRFLGAGNIGPNPTFGEDARKIEIHLLDFDGDLYGQEIEVEFVARLRATKKFSGVEELLHQMRIDIQEARRIGEELNRAE